jgi:hypothetical protein
VAARRPSAHPSEQRRHNPSSERIQERERQQQQQQQHLVITPHRRRSAPPPPPSDVYTDRVHVDDDEDENAIPPSERRSRSRAVSNNGIARGSRRGVPAVVSYEEEEEDGELLHIGSQQHSRARGRQQHPPPSHAPPSYRSQADLDFYGREDEPVMSRGRQVPPPPSNASVATRRRPVFEDDEAEDYQRGRRYAYDDDDYTPPEVRYPPKWGVDDGLGGTDDVRPHRGRSSSRSRQTAAEKANTLTLWDRADAESPSDAVDDAYVTDPTLGSRAREQRTIARELKKALVALRVAQRTSSLLVNKARERLIKARGLARATVDAQEVVKAMENAPLTLHVIHHHETGASHIEPNAPVTQQTFVVAARDLPAVIASEEQRHRLLNAPAAAPQQQQTIVYHQPQPAAASSQNVVYAEQPQRQVYPSESQAREVSQQPVGVVQQPQPQPQQHSATTQPMPVVHAIPYDAASAPPATTTQRTTTTYTVGAEPQQPTTMSRTHSTSSQRNPELVKAVTTYTTRPAPPVLRPRPVDS